MCIFHLFLVSGFWKCNFYIGMGHFLFMPSFFPWKRTCTLRIVCRTSSWKSRFRHLTISLVTFLVKFLNASNYSKKKSIYEVYSKGFWMQFSEAASRLRIFSKLVQSVYGKPMQGHPERRSSIGDDLPRTPCTKGPPLVSDLGLPRVPENLRQPSACAKTFRIHRCLEPVW
jgi:hypothetical protein